MALSESERRQCEPIKAWEEGRQAKGQGVVREALSLTTEGTPAPAAVSHCCTSHTRSVIAALLIPEERELKQSRRRPFGKY